MLNVKNILFAHDSSPRSHQALSYAIDLANHTDAKLHLVYAEVLHAPPFDPKREPSSEREKIRKYLQKHAGDLPENRVVREVVRDIAVAPALLSYAEEHDIDLIVMGTHGRRGVRQILIGSVAEEVVRRASCPVLTVRRQKEPRDAMNISSLLAPVDFSSHSREALQYARELAAFYSAGLTLLHVVEETLHPAFYGPGVGSVYDVKPNIEEQAIKRLKYFYGKTKGQDVEVSFIAQPGRAQRAISHYAEESGHDLIVMATHGRTGFEHFTMGSVAERVVRRAPCPVFTVKSFGKSLLSERSGNARSEE